MSGKIDRREYQKRYREANKERIKELQRKNYLKRKYGQNDDDKADEGVLHYLKERKLIRNENMTYQRRCRRIALQRAIYNELEREESTI